MHVAVTVLLCSLHKRNRLQPFKIIRYQFGANMNGLNSLLGNVSADVNVKVTFDPMSLVLLALAIVAAIIISGLALKTLK